MDKANFKLLIFINFLCLTLTACLEQAGKVGSGAPAFTMATFEGAKAAVNKNGPIEVQWQKATATPHGYAIYKLSGGNFQIIGKVDGNSENFVDSDTKSGVIYTYKVQVIQEDDTETANSVFVRGMSFNGILAVSDLAKDSAIIWLPAFGAADKVTVYAKPKYSKVPSATLELTNEQATANITGLYSGVQYDFSIKAYSADLGKEEENDVVMTAQTLSDTFKDNDTDSDYEFKGFMLVQGFGNAPNAPVDPSNPTWMNVDPLINVARIPTQPTIRLSWLPFVGSVETTKYKLIRAAVGAKLNTAIADTATCSATTPDSCVVCITNGTNGNQALTCEDSNIGAPPAQYYYLVSKVKTDDKGNSWTEEVPETMAIAHATKVPVPPDNMVLAHRDSINWEMCLQMGRDSDPLNHQACSYSGLGATPKNSGSSRFPRDLNLDPTHYDFGYNLFVDRWESACNWSRSKPTQQKCGNTLGCIGTDPIATNDPRGDLGDVYQSLTWSTNAANGFITYETCFVKTTQGWLSARGVWANTTAAPYLKNVITNDPGPKKSGGTGGLNIPYGWGDQTSEWAFCQAQEDPNYGKKRLPRLRETRGYGTPAAQAAEPFYVGNVTAVNNLVMDYLGHDASTGYGCNSRNHAGLTYSLTMDGDNPLQNLLIPTQNIMRTVPWENRTDLTNGDYMIIGSLETSQCLTRFGVQDYFGNVHEVTSDRMDCNSSRVCTFSSGLDSGNDDLSRTPAFAFDGTRGPLPANGSYMYLTSGSTALNYVHLPMGLALKTAEEGSISKSMYSQRFPTEAQMLFNTAPDPNLNCYQTPRRATYTGGAATYGSAGRFTLLGNNGCTSPSRGMRCVLPAE